MKVEIPACRSLRKISKNCSTNGRHREHHANVPGRISRRSGGCLRSALKDRQTALTDLIDAIREYRKASEQPLTLRGSEYAHAVQELNKAIDRAEGFLQ